MRRVHALGAAVIGAALVAGATAFAASDQTTAQRHRLAINMVVNDTTDTATFTLHRLRANTLTDEAGERLDSGTASMGGGAFGDEYRNGMKVFNVVRHPTLVGQGGTLRLVQRYDESEMQNGVRVRLGTWRIAKGTGTYLSAKGSGRYVAIKTNNGRTFVRQEGWVTLPG